MPGDNGEGAGGKGGTKLRLSFNQAKLQLFRGDNVLLKGKKRPQPQE